MQFSVKLFYLHYYPTSPNSHFIYQVFYNMPSFRLMEEHIIFFLSTTITCIVLHKFYIIYRFLRTYELLINPNPLYGSSSFS
jgi:hypothetical protein